MTLLSRVLGFVFCKIFARWVYKNTRISLRWQDAMRRSLEFEALYLNTRMRCHEAMRCSLEFDALYFVKYLFARWVYKNTRISLRLNDMMRCSLEFEALYFVKYLQDGFTKHTHLMTWCNALLSRVWCFVFCKIFARWVYKNTRISLRWHQSTVSPILDAPFWSENDGFTKTHAWDEMTWCDALLSRVGCFVFCKIVARWVYKNTRMRWDDMMRCVALSSWMLCLL